jgi:hypothetical protein
VCMSAETAGRCIVWGRRTSRVCRFSSGKHGRWAVEWVSSVQFRFIHPWAASYGHWMMHKVMSVVSQQQLRLNA